MIVSRAGLAAGTIEERVREATASIEAVLNNDLAQSRGAADAARIYLAIRALEDFRAGQFLAGEGRPLQMASCVRAGIESIHLFDLFTRQPEQAERWSERDNYHEFAPAKVRKALDRQNDPLYSALCELSHPRFAGLALTFYVKVRGEDGDAQVVGTFTGGLPLQVPRVLLATMYPSVGVAMLVYRIGDLPITPHARRGWPDLTRRVLGFLSEGCAAVFAALPQNDTDTVAAGAAIRDVIGGYVDGVDLLEAALEQER